MKPRHVRIISLMYIIKNKYSFINIKTFPQCTAYLNTPGM